VPGQTLPSAAGLAGAARGGAASDEAELQQLVDDVAARHKLRCHDCSPLSSGRSYLEDATRGLGLSLRVGFDPLGKRLFYDLSSVTEGSPPPPRQPVDALRADLEQALRSRFPGVTVTAASLPHTENVTLVLTSRSSSGSSGSAENQFDSERAFAIVAEVAAEQGLKRVGETRVFYAGRLFGPSPHQRELTVIMQVWAEPLVEIHVRCASPECRERQLAVARTLERRLQAEFGKERAAIRPGP